MKITFEGKAKVIAKFEGYTTITDLDQTLGGEGTALNPFQLMLVSVSCCTGLFCRQYLEKHNISLANKHIEISFELDANHDLKKANVALYVGKDLTEQQKTGLINTLKACKVKKHLRQDIEFAYEII
jgi:uncharacterized OsmC-like protein